MFGESWLKRSVPASKGEVLEGHMKLKTISFGASSWSSWLPPRSISEVTLILRNPIGSNEEPIKSVLTLRRSRS